MFEDTTSRATMAQSAFLIVWMKSKIRGRRSAASPSPSELPASATNPVRTPEDWTVHPDFEMACVCLAWSAATFSLVLSHFSSKWFVLVSSLVPKFQHLAHSFHICTRCLCEVHYKPVNHPDVFHHCILTFKDSTQTLFIDLACTVTKTEKFWTRLMVMDFDYLQKFCVAGL